MPSHATARAVISAFICVHAACAPVVLNHSGGTNASGCQDGQQVRQLSLSRRGRVDRPWLPVGVLRKHYRNGRSSQLSERMARIAHLGCHDETLWFAGSICDGAVEKGQGAIRDRSTLALSSSVDATENGLRSLSGGPAVRSRSGAHDTTENNLRPPGPLMGDD
jgi:hypothetical protein